MPAVSIPDLGVPRSVQFGMAAVEPTISTGENHVDSLFMDHHSFNFNI